MAENKSSLRRSLQGAAGLYNSFITSTAINIINQSVNPRSMFSRVGNIVYDTEKLVNQYPNARYAQNINSGSKYGEERDRLNRPVQNKVRQEWSDSLKPKAVDVQAQQDRIARFKLYKQKPGTRPEENVLRKQVKNNIEERKRRQATTKPITGISRSNSISLSPLGRTYQHSVEKPSKFKLKSGETLQQEQVLTVKGKNGKVLSASASRQAEYQKDPANFKFKEGERVQSQAYLTTTSKKTGKTIRAGTSRQKELQKHIFNQVQYQSVTNNTDKLNQSVQQRLEDQRYISMANRISTNANNLRNDHVRATENGVKQHKTVEQKAAYARESYSNYSEQQKKIQQIRDQGLKGEGLKGSLDPYKALKGSLGGFTPARNPIDLSQFAAKDTPFKVANTSWGSIAGDMFGGIKDAITDSFKPGSTKIEDEYSRVFHGGVGESLTAVKGFTANLDGTSTLSKRGYEAYLKATRAEAAKFVRDRGDNVDPFDDTKAAAKLARRRTSQKNIAAGDRLNDATRAYMSNMNIAGKYQPLQNNKNPFAPPNNVDQSKVINQLTKDKKQFEINNRAIKNDKYVKAIAGWENTTNFQHSKGFTPREGINGYGLGYRNFIEASRGELLVRGIRFAALTGFSEVGLNALGMMTFTQYQVTKAAAQKSVFKAMMTPGAQAVGLTFASALGTMVTGGTAGDFLEQQASGGAALIGWRIGSSFGGAIGSGRPRSTSSGMIDSIKQQGLKGAVRGAGGLLGGLTGAALGIAVVAGASATLQDLGSNRSKIRKVAKDLGTRSATMSLAETRQSLTARQATISKLAKSGLNDRALMLGNEARILKGNM